MASGRKQSFDAYALPSDADQSFESSPLGFVGDRALLVQRFLLAEVLAPPLALRGRGGVRPDGGDGASGRRGKRSP